MVVDRLACAATYHGLSPLLRRALQHLAETDWHALPPGRHDVDGSRLFAIVSDYDTKPADDVPWEAHRRYIDVQYVLSGVERIGHAPLSRLDAGAYDDGRDLLPASGPGEFVTLDAGAFAILFPQDAHRPGVAVDAPQPVRKVVLKVAVDPDSM